MSLLLIALSTVCASLPMIGFLALVWWLDRYDREPVGMVLAAFAWGAFGAVPTAIFASTVLAIALGVLLAIFLPGIDQEFALTTLGAVVVAPVAEEPSKALVLLPIAFSRHFDNMTDGFVYGAAAGLGFGMIENFMYFVGAATSVDTWLGTVLIRTFYSAVMHATATAAVGAGLGWGRFRSRGWMAASGALGLIIAIGIHTTWNGLLTIDQHTVSRAAWQVDLALLPLLVLVTFAVFEACLIEETRTIRHELDEEARNGVIPATHPKILASWWRRMGHNWVPAGLDKWSYVAAATSLALRKRQIHLMGETAPDWYYRDVEVLRRKLRDLLAA